MRIFLQKAPAIAPKRADFIELDLDDNINPPDLVDVNILDMIDDEIAVTPTLPRMPPMRPVAQKTPKSSNKIPTPAAPIPSTSTAPKSNSEMDPCPVCMG